jgi:hypothetical protein
MQSACAILSSAACLDLSYFFTLSRNYTIFGRGFANIKCVDFLYKFYLKYFLFLEDFSEILLSMYTVLRAKYPLFLSGSKETWTFSMDFRNILKYRLVWKFVEWKPSCFMRTDGQMDRGPDRWVNRKQRDRHVEANIRFLQFCECI